LIRSTDIDRKFLEFIPKIARLTHHLAKDEERFKDVGQDWAGVGKFTGINRAAATAIADFVQADGVREKVLTICDEWITYSTWSKAAIIFSPQSKLTNVSAFALTRR
jgi:hypothetical protein